MVMINHAHCYCIHCIFTVQDKIPSLVSRPLPDFISRLWRDQFLHSYKTKSGRGLGRRLVEQYKNVFIVNCWTVEGKRNRKTWLAISGAQVRLVGPTYCSSGLEGSSMKWTPPRSFAGLPKFPWRQFWLLASLHSLLFLVHTIPHHPHQLEVGNLAIKEDTVVACSTGL